MNYEKLQKQMFIGGVVFLAFTLALEFKSAVTEADLLERNYTFSSDNTLKSNLIPN